MSKLGYPDDPKVNRIASHISYSNEVNWKITLRNWFIAPNRFYGDTIRLNTYESLVMKALTIIDENFVSPKTTTGHYSPASGNKKLRDIERPRGRHNGQWAGSLYL